MEILKQRAELYAQIRSFFLQRQVMEVDAPLVAAATVTDLHIESIPLQLQQHGQWHERYLITSPEFHMKQLLVAGSPSIYFLGKVFRQGEHGSRHHHEFTMLEWYRLDWEEQQLMQEVCELLAVFLPDRRVKKISYADLFFSVLAINPHRCTLAELQRCVHDHVDVNNIAGFTVTDCLDVLFTHCIEPALKDITFVYNYPAAQAALAKIAIDEHGNTVARRFEVFIDNLELANGYYELTDATEQRKRFMQDIILRQQQNRCTYPLDESLLSALEKGLPGCAGVALGIDRLLMKVLNKSSIQEVLFLL